MTAREALISKTSGPAIGLSTKITGLSERLKHRTGCDLMIPIVKPLIDREEIDSVIQVMESGTITEGPRVKEFESKFANFIGTEYAIAVSSGTAALHVSLLSSGIGKGDEVITTPFTFIATANSILYTGAKPVFADIEEDTFIIDPEDVKRKITKKTKAVIPVDLFGHPADMKAIMDIANDSGLRVIEDACQAHGAACGSKKSGSYDVGCFSFYPSENMTTGEGGIITTDDAVFAEKARMLRSHGSRARQSCETLGFNLRMTDICAAIGLVQLKKIDYYNERRIENAQLLNELLGDIDGIITPGTRPGCTHVFHQYTMRVTNKFHLLRDELVSKLAEAGIGASVYYPIPIHLQPFYRKLGYKESHPIAEQVSKEVVSLPVHPAVSREDIDTIVETVLETLT